MVQKVQTKVYVPSKDLFPVCDDAIAADGFQFGDGFSLIQRLRNEMKRCNQQTENLYQHMLKVKKQYEEEPN